MFAFTAIQLMIFQPIIFRMLPSAMSRFCLSFRPINDHSSNFLLRSEPNLHFYPIKDFSSAKSHPTSTMIFLSPAIFFPCDYKTLAEEKMSEKAKLFDNKQFYRFVTFYLIYCCSFSVVYTKIKRRKMWRKIIIELFFFHSIYTFSFVYVFISFAVFSSFSPRLKS